MTVNSRKALATFISVETAGGLVLLAAAIAAMAIANSALAAHYSAWLSLPVSLSVGGFALDKNLGLWINDGLMAVFFFLIGLEVKREILGGQLSSWKQASLPVYAAIGGMVVPALIFVSVNAGYPENLQGWAIPAATDIAFALGLLALLGNRVPASLKALLLAIAIIDDIGAILVIALFYTANLSVGYLALALIPFVGMIILNRMGVGRITAYALLAILLWLFVLKSGVHATLAGVVAALTIPVTVTGGKPLERLEHSLHPWVAFAILPIFAFANAGVSLSGITPGDMLAPLPLGIAAGLILGKQVGIFGFAWLAIRAGWTSLPRGMITLHFYGLSCLAGVGFTMSLFIGGLAFDTPQQLDAVKLGVLGGSIMSALIGLSVLFLASAKETNHRETSV
ncbi:MAG: Na+/H+ antiporter NhaA [Sphingomonas bacterium]|nr:Na+/H+ antiporter NhaA [Sphingomonas bacterium]